METHISGVAKQTRTNPKYQLRCVVAGCQPDMEQRWPLDCAVSQSLTNTAKKLGERCSETKIQKERNFLQEHWSTEQRLRRRAGPNTLTARGDGNISRIMGRRPTSLLQLHQRANAREQSSDPLDSAGAPGVRIPAYAASFAVTLRTRSLKARINWVIRASIALT